MKNKLGEGGAVIVIILIGAIVVFFYFNQIVKNEFEIYCVEGKEKEVGCFVFTDEYLNEKYGNYNDLKEEFWNEGWCFRTSEKGSEIIQGKELNFVIYTGHCIVQRG